MFKIAANPTFTHDVEIRVPVDGGFDTQSIKTTFVVIDTEEYRELVDNDEFTLLRRVIVRLDDVVGEDDKPKEYNDALRDRLLSLAYVRIGLLRAYNNAIVGARVKN